jgi:hypothetical protein
MNKQDYTSSQRWYTKHEGVTMGPLTEARIRQLLLEGKLDLADQISEDQQAWVCISEVPSVIPLQLRAESGDKEAMAKVETRARLRAEDRASGRRFPLLPLLVSVGIVGGLLLVSLWVGMPEEDDSPQCDLPPGPGVNWRNCVLLNVDVGSASLVGANLNSAVLQQAKLSATQLNGADLSYADMRKSDLRYAQMQNSRLVGTNLQGVDLRDADLSRADLRFADLTGAQIRGAVWTGARLDGAIWIDGRECEANSTSACRD